MQSYPKERCTGKMCNPASNNEESPISKQSYRDRLHIAFGPMPWMGPAKHVVIQMQLSYQRIPLKSQENPG